jgi:hypothetical protein
LCALKGALDLGFCGLACHGSFVAPNYDPIFEVSRIDVIRAERVSQPTVCASPTLYNVSLCSSKFGFRTKEQDGSLKNFPFSSKEDTVHSVRFDILRRLSPES